MHRRIVRVISQSICLIVLQLSLEQRFSTLDATEQRLKLRFDMFNSRVTKVEHLLATVELKAAKQTHLSELRRLEDLQTQLATSSLRLANILRSAQQQE